jgi:hypothetical protein
LETEALVGQWRCVAFFSVAGSSAVGGSWLWCFAFQERSKAFVGVRQYNGIDITPLTVFGQGKANKGGLQGDVVSILSN